MPGHLPVVRETDKRREFLANCQTDPHCVSGRFYPHSLQLTETDHVFAVVPEDGLPVPSVLSFVFDSGFLSCEA